MGRMGGRKAIALAALVAAAAAGFALGPSLASGASDSYVGDIEPPHTTPNGVTSGITFNVVLKKNDKGKRVPRFVRHFQSRVVRMYCEDGTISYQVGFFPHPTLEVPIHRRKFDDSVNRDGDVFEIAGQIPKSGRATGTIRMFSAAFDVYPNCDSGVVAWTASQGG